MNTTKLNRKSAMTYDQAFALNGKIPPQSLDLEESVLGALLIDQNALTNVIGIVRPNHFYSPEHRAIYEAITKLFDDNKPIDILTVVEQMKREGTLESAGGAYKISSLTNRVTSAAHIEYHARVLIEKFIQRELIRLSTETITEAYDETTDVLGLLDKTETNLLNINDGMLGTQETDMSSLWQQTIQEIKDLKESDRNTLGISSGFVEVDKLLGGFQPGTLIVLGARPSMGKTSFAMNIARNVAVDFKKPVAFFSLEMTRHELVKRLISAESEISSSKFKRGDQLEFHEIEQLRIKSEHLQDAPIWIDDTFSLTIFELRAKCRRMQQQHKIEMVFLDYLQLMKGGDFKSNGNREQEISTISRQLKGLSKELGIPILALSQLNRKSEDRRGDTKEPVLSDLRESGAIEQDADIVLFINRPEVHGFTDPDALGETIGMADIIIAKHRAGATGKARLRFRPEITKFENRNLFGQTSSVTSGNSYFSNKPNVFSSKMNANLDAESYNIPADTGEAPF